MANKINHAKLAADILEAVGGRENVSSVTHCITRLRFHLKDAGIPKSSEVEKIPGVLSIVVAGGQYQVVIGPEVADVYVEVCKAGGFEVQAIVSDEVKKSRSKLTLKTAFSMLCDTMSGIVMPMIGPLAGAGMIKALLTLGVTFGLLSKDAQSYQIFYMVADGVFYYMPFFLAFSAGKKFNCNPYLSLVFAAMLVNPTYINLRTAGEAVHLFGILPVTLASYTSSVIPIILIVYFQSIVEHFVVRYVPKPIKTFFVPMVVLVITVPVGFVVLGPLGSIIGGYLSTFFTMLDTHLSWLNSMLIGALCPLLVMTGMHYALGSAQTVQRATMGYATIMAPGMVCSNMAQSAATFGVALRSRNPQLKSLASSLGVTALCGITEPTLYGIGMKYRTPLYCAMAGGAVGGLYAGLMHVKQWAYGTSTVFALPVYIGEDHSFIHICIAVAIAMAVAFILSYITFKDPKDDVVSNADTADSVAAIKYTA